MDHRPDCTCACPLTDPLEMKDAIIEAIIAVARNPVPEIVEITELEHSDGNWYRSHALPFGLTATGKERAAGFGYRSNDITYGILFPTREAAAIRFAEIETRHDSEFRAKLDAMTIGQLRAQARWWLQRVVREHLATV